AAQAERVLAVLASGDHAQADDRYALASLELKRSICDTRPAARANDPALRALASLARGGFDLAPALKKDRSLKLDHLYYVGFHFAELGHPLGGDLLEEVAKKGGRTKLGKRAKNKLALVDGGA